MGQIQFGIVGGGWRSEFFLRIAQACPGRFHVAGMVVRSEEKARPLEKTFGVKTYRDIDTMLKHITLGDDGFVVTSIPRDVNPAVMLDLVEKNIPVLSETPPAGDADAMADLYLKVQAAGGKVQVAEQYHLQPLHAARLALAGSGLLGPISQAQISAAHGYHGISLMRRMLGITFEPATVRGFGFSSKNVQGADRNGPPTAEKIGAGFQEIFHFDFGDKLGIYDFNFEQYFSYVRNERLLVRGERGEIINDQATYLLDYQTPISHRFSRHAAGENGNLEGLYLKGIQFGDRWLYRNPLAPAHLTDDEIAIAHCMQKMAHYVATGEDFYSLAEASQDHYLGLVGAEAAKTGQAIATSKQVWA